MGCPQNSFLSKKNCRVFKISWKTHSFCKKKNYSFIAFVETNDSKIDHEKSRLFEKF